MSFLTAMSWMMLAWCVDGDCTHRLALATWVARVTITSRWGCSAGSSCGRCCRASINCLPKSKAPGLERNGARRLRFSRDDTRHSGTHPSSCAEVIRQAVQAFRFQVRSIFLDRAISCWCPLPLQG